MGATYTIIDEKKFSDHDVNAEDLKWTGDRFEGNLEIEENGEWKTVTGEHSPYDYESDYGFVLDVPSL